MAIARVGGSTKVAQTAAAAGFTIPYSPTAGNLVVVAVAAGTGNSANDPLPSSVKDNNNNALTVITSAITSDGQRAYIAYGIAVSGATSYVVAGANANTFATYNLTE